MDILYLYKSAFYGNELRYSLRSLANVKHDRVFIAGDTEPWITNTIHISNRTVGYTCKNALSNLKKALASPELSKDFLLFNDDIYPIRPVEFYPTHMGLFTEHIEYLIEVRKPKIGRYIKDCIRTLEYLQSQGIAEPLSYELHRPMPYHKTTLKNVLRKIERDCVGWYGYKYQTIYFNLHPPDKLHQDTDGKSYIWDIQYDHDVLSSGPDTFKKLEANLKRLFPGPSIYELQ